MKKESYLGYRAADRAEKWAKFFDEKAKPRPSAAAQKALEKGPLAESLPPFSEAKKLAEKGAATVETGFSMEKDGSFRVAVWTPMPSVRPEMWSWWFGWHGSRSSRYKIWHPAAHVSARWADGRDDEKYVGRTSIIEEYIGSTLEKAAIQFVSPLEVGFSASDFDEKSGSVFICARLGLVDFPIDFGWLVHQIRLLPDGSGSEMRSRFWMGGEHISVRGGGFAGRFFSNIIRKVRRLPDRQARELLAHCAEEMPHLAAVLPALFQEFSKK